MTQDSNLDEALNASDASPFGVERNGSLSTVLAMNGDEALEWRVRENTHEKDPDGEGAIKKGILNYRQGGIANSEGLGRAADEFYQIAYKIFVDCENNPKFSYPVRASCRIYRKRTEQKFDPVKKASEQIG